MSSTLASLLCCCTAFVTHDSCESHCAGHNILPRSPRLMFPLWPWGEEILLSSCLNIPRKQVLGASDSRCKNCSIMDSSYSPRPGWNFRTYRKHKEEQVYNGKEFGKRAHWWIIISRNSQKRGNEMCWLVSKAKGATVGLAGEVETGLTWGTLKRFCTLGL